MTHFVQFYKGIADFKSIFNSGATASEEPKNEKKPANTAVELFDRQHPTYIQGN